MRRARRREVSSRLTVRRGASRWLAVATGALILALVLEVALGVSAAAPVRAQVIATATPSVTAHGTGEATVPAETATVQIFIGQGGSGSSAFPRMHREEAALRRPAPSRR